MDKTDTEIKGRDLTRHLKAMGVDAVCPACHHDTMQVSVKDPDGTLEGDAPAVHVTQTLTGHPQWGYGQYLHACTRCGFIRYFRDIEVLAFLNSEDDNEQR